MHNLKVTMLALFAGLFFSHPAIGQFKQSIERETANYLPIPTGAEIMPGLLREEGPMATPPSLWTVQFNYESVDSANGNGSHAGICFTGTEFWVSKWNSDTIIRFSPTCSYIGVFNVPGAFSTTTGGIRGLATSGLNVYAANNTSTIRVISPITRAVTSTITAPAMTGGSTGNEGVRHLTFDPTANAGAGGLWCASWDTDIKLISLAGAQLVNIGAGTHTLTSMYGSAFDSSSTGGPYLWMFDQAGSGANIVQIKISTGGPTGLSHNVSTDIVPGGSGLAGGLCFIPAGILNPTENTLAGIYQNGNNTRLFGYEIDDPPAIDAEMVSGKPTEALSQLPLNHAHPLTFEGSIKNAGTTVLTSVSMNLNIILSGSSVFTNTQTTSNLASFATSTLTSTGFTPSAIGTYTVELTCSTSSGQVDPFLVNDTIKFTFMVTDSTFNHSDENYNTGGYLVGDPGFAMTTFIAYATDTVSSVSVSLNDVNAGDSLYAAVFSVSGGFPNYPPVSSSSMVILDGSTFDFTFHIPGGLSISNGQPFAIGIFEGASGLTTIQQSNKWYNSGSNYFYTFASQTVTASNIQTARAILAHTGNASGVGIIKGLPEGSTLSVYPNPSSNVFFLDVRMDKERSFNYKIVDALGRDLETFAQVNGNNLIQTLDMSSYPSGVYYLIIEGLEFKENRKLILAH